MKPCVATGTLLAFMLGLGLPAHAQSDDAARDWLERMSAAMSQMSYQGTFVYVQGDNVETMRITHVADEQGTRERLVSVTGPQREILRDSNGVRLVRGDEQSVLEDPAFGRSFFPEIPLDRLDVADSPYVLHMGPGERIAGHQGRKLKILPRDEFRYGYSLWLEENSALLLKWELLGEKNRSLAKLMFTDLRLGSEVNRSELNSPNPLKDFNKVESGLPSDQGLAQSRPRWKPAFLPPGFHLTAHRYQGRQQQHIFEHLVYSDGIVAVSVYVETTAKDERQETGLRRLGTTHAFTRQSEDVLITVVGDVPAVTVKTIANAVALTSK
jgi:sigma-E factor negative regulatory protein RseB